MTEKHTESAAVLSHLTSLPTELQLEITAHLPDSALWALARTNRYFKTLLNVPRPTPSRELWHYDTWLFAEILERSNCITTGQTLCRKCIWSKTPIKFRAYGETEAEMLVRYQRGLKEKNWRRWCGRCVDSEPILSQSGYF
jgi:hypothetical protein